MKKCLIIIHNLSKSGSPQTFLHVAKCLKNNGFQIDVLAFAVTDKNNELFYLDEYKKISDNVFFGKTNPRGFLYRLFPFICFRKHKKTILLNKYDILFSNNMYFSAYCLKKRHSFVDTKVVLYYLGNANIKSKRHLVKRKMEYIHKLLLNLDGYLGISNDSFVSNLEYKGIQKMRLMDYPETFYPDIAKEYHKNHKTILGQIGYFCSNKNQIFSLNVLKLLKEHGYNCEIHFIGYSSYEEPDYLEEIKKTVFIYNLQDCVKFLPSNYDKETFFKKIDILLLPSIYEGLPISLLEAQFSNTYCLASDSVSKEVEFGLCERLPLEKGAWERAIISERFKNAKTSTIKYGMHEFDKELMSFVNRLFR